jgi:YhcH/YjgK/YiaL family protein
MKKIALYSAIVIGSLMSSCGETGDSADKESADKNDPQQWFDQKLGNLKLKPHESVNKEEMYRQYNANPAYWDKVFAFLQDTDLKTLSAGRHEIDGDNVYAMVTEAPTKDLDSTKFESHRKYIDVQYVIDGEEKIAVEPVEGATVTVPYDDTKDIAHYSGEGKTYTATPGTFFIFFPTDAHRPSITPGGNKTDKKLVIKVRAAQ